jgi:hypothetical protein
MRVTSIHRSFGRGVLLRNGKGVFAFASTGGATAGCSLPTARSAESGRFFWQEPTPPIDSDWDAGTGDYDEPEHPDGLIMGEIAVPPQPPLMGKVAPPTKGE